MTNHLDSHLTAYGDTFGYAFDNDIILNWYPERIMRLCQNSSNMLELGIGHGYTTNRFSQYFSHHLVVDGSASVIDQFHHQFPECKARIVQSYFEDFETDKLFDIIVLGFVLEHVVEPRSILLRYKNFLASGGRCFIAVPNGESLHRRLGHEAGLLDDMMQLGVADLELGHKRLYSVDSLSQEIESAGYSITRKEGIFLKPLMTSQLQSLQLEPNVFQSMCKVGIAYPELCCGLLFEAIVEES